VRVIFSRWPEPHIFYIISDGTRMHSHLNSYLPDAPGQCGSVETSPDPFPGQAPFSVIKPGFNFCLFIGVVHVCFSSVRFSFFSAMLSDRLKRISLK